MHLDFLDWGDETMYVHVLCSNKCGKIKSPLINGPHTSACLERNFKLHLDSGHDTYGCACV